jgi:hypothetical protein
MAPLHLDQLVLRSELRRLCQELVRHCSHLLLNIEHISGMCQARKMPPKRTSDSRLLTEFLTYVDIHGTLAVTEGQVSLNPLTVFEIRLHLRIGIGIPQNMNKLSSRGGSVAAGDVSWR